MAVLRNLFEGLRTLLGKDRAEQDMDEELHAFLDESVEHNLRTGMNYHDATRAARAAIGSLESIKEEIRSTGWEAVPESVWQDIRYAGRVLRKDRVFTCVAVLTLALGIGANTAIFNLIDAVMLRVLPVANPQEIMQVRIHDPRWPGQPTESFTNPLWEGVRDRQDIFSSAFAWGQEGFNLAQGGAVHLINGIFVSDEFFSTLRVQPAAGRLIAGTDSAAGCAAVAVLSYDFWQDHYGLSRQAIGSTLSLSSHPFEVVGVTAPGFHGVHVGSKFDVAAPICATAVFDGKQPRLRERAWWWLNVMGRIKPGITQREAAARLAVLSPGILSAALPQEYSATGQKEFLRKTLLAVPAANGTSSIRERFNQPLEILMGIVGLVLLIACSNVASLLLARGAARQKEFAVRQALGASRTRLIRQLLTECVLFSSAGAVLGVLFAHWGSALLLRFVSTSREPISLDLSFNLRMLGFAAASTITTVIVFGLLPALRSTRLSLMSSIKGNQTLASRSIGHLSKRRWIVGLQVALSLVLLVAAGLLLRSFANLMALDLGFDRHNILLVRTNLQAAKIPPEREAAMLETIEINLRGLPGVVSASRSTMTPMMGGAWNFTIYTDWSKHLTGDNALAWMNGVSPAYFDTLRMVRLAGRPFTRRDSATAPKVAIVNQALARRFFPHVNPLGKTFRLGGRSEPMGAAIEVVGLVKDSKYESFQEDALPTAFFPAGQVPTGLSAQTFELRTKVSPTALMRAVQSTVTGLNPELPLEFRSLAEQVDDSVIAERMLALLSGFFGGVALLLAMVGLYGTLSYVVTQRQGELGLRMALGADSRSILQLILSDVLAVLLVGVTAGVGLSLAVTQLLRRMLFGLGARDAATIVGAIAILAAVALLASYLPARRAISVDPMIALRHD